MKVQTKTVLLDRQGVDEASAVIEDWLEAAEIPHGDVLRIRLTAEELLAAICGHGGESVHAELRFGRWLGDWRLQIRYDGERFDPTAPREDEMHEWLAELLSRTGFMPTWRARGRENELQLRIPGGGPGRRRDARIVPGFPLHLGPHPDPPSGDAPAGRAAGASG